MAIPEYTRGTDLSNRDCPQCGARLVRRSSDYDSSWRRRKYCSNHCARKMAAWSDPGLRFTAKVDSAAGHGPNGDCHVWTAGKTSDGYGTISVDGRDVLAHRYSYFLAFGTLPPELMVCHRCDNPPCVNPDHLFLGDNIVNMGDMASKGRARPPKGERHASAKLNEEKVRAILLDGRTAAAIARDYGVSDVAILQLKAGRTWKNITQAKS